MAPLRGVCETLGVPRASRSDVAHRAGVAPTTVSNVLNGRAEVLRISPDTAQRVREAAHELGYIPQASARALRGGTSHTIGLLLAALPPTPYVPVVYDVLTAAMTRTQQRGHLTLPVAQPDSGTGTSYVDQMMSDVDVAGVVCEYSQRNSEAGRRLCDLDVPVVWMSFSRPQELPPGVAHVYVDERPGVEEVLSQVDLPRGRRIVAVVGPVYRPERLVVARRIFGRRLDIIEADTWLPDSGAAATRQALEDIPRLDAIFCTDDLLAIGAMRALAEAKIAVPDDISVIGYGGYSITEGIEAGMTTVHWPLRDLTIAAIDALVDHVEGPAPLRQHKHAPVTRVIGTTAVIGRTARLRSV